MVYRNKDLNFPPPELIDPKWDTLKREVLLERDTHNANTACYRDCTLESLILLYKNKCAICERDRGEELQVDHYRPRKPRNFLTDIKYNQPGYYWLTYEWSNLIPICSKCNGNKSNKFPLTGWTELNRVDDHYNNHKILRNFSPYDRGWLQTQELPLLVNPETELNPEKHFIYTREGRIRGKTDEGDETIITYGLNRRDLVRTRLKLREKYVRKLKEALDGYIQTRNIDELKGELKALFREIRDNADVDAEYSLFHVNIYTYFQYFIDNKLPINLRGLAVKYFNEFKRKNVV